MVIISALVLVFVMLMNRNSVTRPPEAQVVYMVQRNADDLEFDHGNWDFSDVEFYGHGVYTEIYDEDGRLLGGTGPAAVTEQMPFSDEGLRTVTGSDGGRYYVYDRALNVGGGVGMPMRRSVPCGYHSRTRRRKRRLAKGLFVRLTRRWFSMCTPSSS